MENWKDNRVSNGFLFLGALNAQISGPTVIEAEFRNNEQQVKLFSEWCHDDITIDEFIPLARQTMMVLFQFLTNQRVAYLDLRSKIKSLMNSVEISY